MRLNLDHGVCALGGLALICAAACGDAKSSSTRSQQDSSNTREDASVAETTGEDASGPGAATSCVDRCGDTACKYDVLTPGACVNEADLTAIRDKDYNVEWNKCVVSAGCGLDVACNAKCFKENTGVTLDCAGCFADLVPCLVNNCGNLCQGGMTPDCSACIGEKCVPAYNECFGELTCPFEYGCADLIDNDQNGLADRADPGCQ